MLGDCQWTFGDGTAMLADRHWTLGIGTADSVVRKSWSALSMDCHLLLDRFLWEHKVARKVKVFWQLLVRNFGQ